MLSGVKRSNTLSVMFIFVYIFLRSCINAGPEQMNRTGRRKCQNNFKFVFVFEIGLFSPSSAD